VNNIVTEPLYKVRKHPRRIGGKRVLRLQFIRVTPRAFECRKHPRPMSDIAWELGDPLERAEPKPSRSRYEPHVGKKQLAKLNRP
jgi:hypothetical protein